MSSAVTQMSIGSGTYVIYERMTDAEPPMMVMYSGALSVSLVPPGTREAFPMFAEFLRDLAMCANELLLDCHPTGEWGREVFGDVTDEPGGR